MARGKSTKRGGGRGKKSSQGSGSGGKLQSILNKGYSESAAQINKLSDISQSLRADPRALDRKVDDVRFILRSMQERQRGITNEIGMVRDEMEEELRSLYRIISQFTNLKESPSLKRVATAAEVSAKVAKAGEKVSLTESEMKLDEIDKTDGVATNSDNKRDKNTTIAFDKSVKVEKNNEYEVAQSVVGELRAEKAIVNRNKLQGALSKAIKKLQEADREANKIQMMGAGMMFAADNSGMAESVRNNHALMGLNFLLFPLLTARSKAWKRMASLVKAGASSKDNIVDSFDGLIAMFDRESKASDSQKTSGWFSALVSTDHAEKNLNSIGDVHSKIRELTSKLRRRSTALLTLKSYFAASSSVMGI